MRPHYIACLAGSLDGRINPGGADSYVRMGSDHDIHHLMALRDQADALLMGGKTFRAYPKRHRALNDSYRPIHAILTRGGDFPATLPPDAPLFQETPPVPVTLFTQCLPNVALKKMYPDSVRWVAIGKTLTAGEIIATISESLAQQGCERVLVEGGGELLALTLEARVLERLYLTLCPVLLGGLHAPPLLQGQGFLLDSAPKTHLENLEKVAEELYLTLRIEYPEPPPG